MHHKFPGVRYTKCVVRHQSLFVELTLIKLLILDNVCSRTTTTSPESVTIQNMANRTTAHMVTTDATTQLVSTTVHPKWKPRTSNLPIYLVLPICNLLVSKSITRKSCTKVPNYQDLFFNVTELFGKYALITHIHMHTRKHCNGVHIL